MTDHATALRAIAGRTVFIPTTAGQHIREAADELDRLRARLARCEEPLKFAYRKLTWDDPDIGSQEVEDALCNALCEVMGDEGFQAWLGGFVLSSWQDEGDDEEDE